MAFTPIEQKIIDTLADGYPHQAQHLIACLDDSEGSITTLRAHICNIRKKLRATPYAIVCEVVHRKAYYRKVQLVGEAAFSE